MFHQKKKKKRYRRGYDRNKSCDIKAGIGVTWPKGKGLLEPPEAIRGKNGFSPKGGVCKPDYGLVPARGCQGPSSAGSRGYP